MRPIVPAISDLLYHNGTAGIYAICAPVATGRRGAREGLDR